MVLVACSNSSTSPDAQIISIDSPPPVDAAIDAPPDAPPGTPMNIQTACMHACDALGVCVMEPVEPECYAECAEDLADCTAEQVQTIDDCSTEACGPDLENSPLIACIVAVSCVEM